MSSVASSPGIRQQLLADFKVTGVWIFISAIFEELSALLSDALGIQPLVAGLTVLCVGLALYEPVCAKLGNAQASFSPAVNFAQAGAGQGSLRHHTLRSAAQAVGGALGAAAAIQIFPLPWQQRFSNYAHGVMPGSSLSDGFLAEATLSFVLCLSILWAGETRFKSAGKLAPYIATIALIPMGTSTSGPFMNPAVAFSWFWNLKGATAFEHIIVFWVGCLLGSYSAGLAWWLFNRPAKPAPFPGANTASEKTGKDGSTPKVILRQKDNLPTTKVRVAANSSKKQK